jgi:hypothetical protein
MKCHPDQAQGQGNHTNTTADNVGHHIHDLLTFGVVGEEPVDQFGSFHKITCLSVALL